MRGDLFLGKRVLILEDEPIIAILLEELIEAAGGEPITMTSLGTVDAILAKKKPDLAILDINIHNKTSFGIGRLLRDLGIPFIFASGYGGKLAPDDLAQVPTVTKPYGLDDLEQAFREAISQQGNRP